MVYLKPFLSNYNGKIFCAFVQAIQIVTGQACYQAYLPAQLTTLRKNEYGPLMTPPLLPSQSPQL